MHKVHTFLLAFPLSCETPFFSSAEPTQSHFEDFAMLWLCWRKKRELKKETKQSCAQLRPSVVVLAFWRWTPLIACFLPTSMVKFFCRPMHKSLHTKLEMPGSMVVVATICTIVIFATSCHHRNCWRCQGPWWWRWLLEMLGFVVVVTAGCTVVISVMLMRILKLLKYRDLRTGVGPNRQWIPSNKW